MVKNQLISFIKFLIFFILIFFNKNAIANPNADQWQDSNKSYKDLLEEGFEVKAYSMNTIETNSGLQLLLFVTVLQNEKELYAMLAFGEIRRRLKCEPNKKIIENKFEELLKTGNTIIKYKGK